MRGEEHQDQIHSRGVETLSEMREVFLRSIGKVREILCSQINGEVNLHNKTLQNIMHSCLLWVRGGETLVLLKMEAFFFVKILLTVRNS